MRRIDEKFEKLIKGAEKSILGMAAALVFAIGFGSMGAEAKTATEVLPAGGIGLFLSDAAEHTAMQFAETKNAEIVKPISDVDEMSRLYAEYDEEIATSMGLVREQLVVARTDSYITVYEEPDFESESVGKLYNDCIGVILSDNEDDWYYIESGNVKGYIPADEDMLTGEEASERKEEIGSCYAVVNAESLFVRAEASDDADIIEIVTNCDELAVIMAGDSEQINLDDSEQINIGDSEQINLEDSEWINVETTEGSGWILAEYVNIIWKYKVAETREEEAERIAAESLSKGEAMVKYALQFVGNRYVWGGVSLTEGADCSGFTLTLYGMYGVSLPHSSITQADYGVPVDGVENAQPGDLVVFSGHVAIYIGNGQIVHAANSRDGIIVSGIDFMPLVCIRRLL